MHYYHRGNRRKRALTDFSIEAERANIRRIIDSFGPEVFERFAGCGDPSRLPVFIIGMPRSGTTLVEQIIASHPAVHGAGELNDLWRILGGIGPWLPTGRNLPEAVADVDPEAWAELGQRFVKRLQRYNKDALRITDKLPFNYTLAGIIRIMLPGARIIHCVRDPRDTCVSCYTTSFQSDRGFTCDLADLGETYRLYWQLMNHWRARSPAGCSRSAMNIWSGISKANHAAWWTISVWTGRMHASISMQTPRRVMTASMTQVRQPAYQTSIGRWRRYQDHIQPLLTGSRRSAINTGSTMPDMITVTDLFSTAMAEASLPDHEATVRGTRELFSAPRGRGSDRSATKLSAQPNSGRCSKAASICSAGRIRRSRSWPISATRRWRS